MTPASSIRDVRVRRGFAPREAFADYLKVHRTFVGHLEKPGGRISALQRSFALRRRSKCRWRICSFALRRQTAEAKSTYDWRRSRAAFRKLGRSFLRPMANEIAQVLGRL